MVTRGVFVGLLAVACFVLVGCGSSGSGGSAGPPGGGGPAGPGQTLTLGTLQVDVDSSGALEVLDFEASPGLPVAFTALYGTTINRLVEVGYGKILYVIPDYYWCGFRLRLPDGSPLGSVQPNPLPPGGVDFDGPAWSPDGSQLAYMSDEGGDNEIWVMDADGSGATQLTDNDLDDRDPTWRPDGQFVIFISERNGRYKLYSEKPWDPKAPSCLVSNALPHFAGPAYSPNGHTLAFASNADIWVMNPGSEPRKLTDTFAWECEPAWSPDGSRIAFARDSDASLPSLEYEVWVMNADGTGQTQLSLDDMNADRAPSWSPDGRQIAFQSHRDGNWEVYVMNADGSGARNVSLDDLKDVSPAWCPAASAERTLIGAPLSDCSSSDPPFGSGRPMVVVGQTDAGLVSAMTVTVDSADFSSVDVSELAHTGSRLAGVKITATTIKGIIEDAGCTGPPDVWDLGGSPPTKTVLVYFSGETGKVTSVMAMADTPFAAGGQGADTTTQSVGGRLVVRGRFVQVYDASRPERNLVTGEARKVVLDGQTGRVVSVD